MIGSNTTSQALRYAVAGTLAVALLSGCGGGGKIASASSGSVASQKSSARGALAQAEGAVAASPRVAALRVALGNAYLRAGRFQSAAASFNDAMDLGDNSGKTALSLALSYVANGRKADAIGLLDDWRDVIPAADLGLALALAGETGRGVSVLSDALRSGEATPKLRQNLAYAYALDGRWREARLMVEQDVPADQVDERISQWAGMARAEDAPKRVAGLLNVQPRNDPGQPSYLALSNNPSAEQLAAETTATVAEPAVAAAPEPAVVPPAGAAMAANDAPSVALPVASTMVSTPVVQPVPVAAAAPQPASPEFSQAFSSLAPRTAAAPKRQAAPARAVAAAAPRATTTAAGGTHLVQLGAFSSAQGARRAWGIFSARQPELRNYRMTINQAVVRGKRVWRVAAGGLVASNAATLCASLKSRGGACFAYAVPRAATPAAPLRGIAGPQNARRR